MSNQTRFGLFVDWFNRVTCDHPWVYYSLGGYKYKRMCPTCGKIQRFKPAKQKKKHKWITFN